MAPLATCHVIYAKDRPIMLGRAEKEHSRYASDTHSVHSLEMDDSGFGMIRAVEAEIHLRGIHGELDVHNSGIKPLCLDGEG